MPTHDTAPKPEDERDFLVEVGRRVRQCRHAISMTRRQLSEHSGLSERYLAQLEAGDGNISILLIRRVARVLRVDLARLLAEPAEQLTSRPTRVALLEAPGAGVGRMLREVSVALSSSLSVPFLDIGREVHADLGVEPHEALQRLGSEACREAQRRVLLRLTASHRRCVVTVGDLPVPDAELLGLLHQRCITVGLGITAAPPIEAGPERAFEPLVDHWISTAARSGDEVLSSVLERVVQNFHSEPRYRTRATDRQLSRSAV